MSDIGRMAPFDDCRDQKSEICFYPKDFLSPLLLTGYTHQEKEGVPTKFLIFLKISFFSTFKYARYDGAETLNDTCPKKCNEVFMVFFPLFFYILSSAKMFSGRKSHNALHSFMSAERPA